MTTDTMPPAVDTTTTLIITSGALINLLTAVAPFADPEADPERLGILRQIHLQAGNGVATATATNQFVLGHARQPCAGRLPQALLPAVAVPRIIAILRDCPAGQLVEVVVTAERITVRTPDAELRFDQGAGVFQDLTGMLDPAGYAEVGLAGVPAFQPRYLAKVHDAVTALGYGDRPARLYFRGLHTPLRIEVEDWFVALLMPIKTREAETAPQVPFALPDTPQPLPAGPVDNGTDVTYPDTDEVTIGRLVRHMALDVHRLQKRIFEEPWPKLPPYAQQNPDERRQAEARRDLYGSTMGAYGVGFLLREFAAAAPEAAAKAARDLWDAWSGGETMGEWAYEWLTEYGVHPDTALAAVKAAAEGRS
jgi:hypothetical protein